MNRCGKPDELDYKLICLKLYRSKYRELDTIHKNNSLNHMTKFYNYSLNNSNFNKMKPNVYLLIWQPHIKFPTLKLKHIVKKSLENSFHTKFHKSYKNLSTVTKLRLEHAVVNHRHVQGTKIQLPKSKYKNSQKLSCDRQREEWTDWWNYRWTDRQTECKLLFSFAGRGLINTTSSEKQVFYKMCCRV